MGVLLCERVHSVPESAPVTDWPLRLLLLAGLISILLFVFYLMWRRWKILTSQSEIRYEKVSEVAPESFVSAASISGLFLGTSPAGNWMLRVMTQDLGMRSRAICQWSPEGVLFLRQGASDVYVGMDLIQVINFGRGVAGTVRAKDSVLMIQWLLGDAIVQSGFRADTSEGHEDLMELQQHVERKLGRSS